MSRPGIERTMFTEWMEANKKFDDASMLRYIEFPTSWVWDRTEKEWHRRKRGRTIGRKFYVHPSSGERYYLRMLLTIVRGPMSYEDICTVDRIIYPDFKSACNSLGLLEDDNEWHQALQEASAWASGRQLRHLFASILTSCEVTDPLGLWETHWRDLSDDLLRSDGMLVLSVESSGIASLLLPGGRTARSRFKIPLKLDDTSTCFIKPNTKLSELMEEVDLIIWDEAPMAHRHGLEAVDRTFKDLLRNSSPGAAQKVFGGKTFVLGGDFRQVLPVVPKSG
ncbi:uncharacterized protein LOC143891952 [Tasmannia lanceolata]|uniref:uncharacterized protein LOC143891952 n=1 Tax=Tasmannia lanceolata TaxID=3420 RepID=UPI0040628769